MDYKKMAEETLKEIRTLEKGYQRWLQVWAQAEAPYKVGEIFHHGTKRIKVKSITAGKVYGDLYEWVIVSEFGTRVVLSMKEEN